MNYFLSEQIGFTTYGVEHAQAKRLKMFHDAGKPAKIVTVSFLLHGHDYIKNLDMVDSDLINLFDYFGDALDTPAKEITISELKFPKEYDVIRDHETEARFHIMQNGKRIIRIQPDQFDVTKIGNVYYYDTNERPIKKIFYDSRGFPSVGLIMNLEYRRVIEHYYKPNGEVFLEVYLDEEIPDFNHAKSFNLLNYKGADYLFNSFMELKIFFYDELNKNYPDEKNVFVSDASYYTSGIVAGMKTDAVKIEHFHSTHFMDDNMDPMTSEVHSSFLSTPEWWSKFDVVLVPTAQQKVDIEKRFDLPIPVQNISVGITDKKNIDGPKIPFINRKLGSIAIAARPAYEKRLDDMIKSVGHVHKTHPEVSLDIYGVADYAKKTDEWKMLNQLIDENNWQNFIKFHGYTNDIDSVFNNAQISMFTSRYEGFGLSLMEAMEHGVPLLAYNFNYGASEMIEDGYNGYLVEPGNIDKLAAQLDQMLSNQIMLSKMSNASYDKSREFSEETIIKKWEELINKY